MPHLVLITGQVARYPMMIGQVALTLGAARRRLVRIMVNRFMEAPEHEDTAAIRGQD